MTTTDTAAGARTFLTEHDHVVSRGEREPDLFEFALPWSVAASVHVRPDTPILVRLHETEHRVVLRFGGLSAKVDVFLPADQIDRLIDVLAVARLRLP